MTTSYAMSQSAATAMPFGLTEFLMLFQNADTEERNMVNDMLSKAKRQFVNTHHKQAISQLHSESKYKNGMWKTHVYENGKRRTIQRKTEEEIIEYLYDFYKSEHDKPLSFTAVFEKLMDKKENEDGRSTHTINDCRRYFDKLSAEIRNKPISDITASDLKRWFVKEYMPTKPIESALRKMIQTISQVFAYAIEEDFCTKNPATKINFSDYVKDCNMERKKTEERSFSIEELKLIKAEAKKNLKNPRNLMILVAIETGLRLGELPVIHKSDIQDGFIHVHRKQLRNSKTTPETYYEVGYTKNEKRHPQDGRYVPITPECAKALQYASELPGDSDYVFHNKDGSWVIHGGYMLHLKRMCKRLGIETDNNHAFRIAFNNRLIELGFSAAERAYILGHAVETNERNYSTHDSRRRFDMQDKLNHNPLSP